MKQIVTYSRFSTSLQNEDSIAAQEDACARYAASLGWSITHNYADEAKSGQDSFRRDFMALQADIRNSKIDGIIVNSIDRLSRRAADLHAFHDLCKFHQVAVHVVELNGELTDLHIGFEGIISQQYIEGIRHKTRTGLRRVVEQGGWGGGKAFGYRVVFAEDGTSSFVVDENQASTVREIFELYASGLSPRKIAAQLNNRGLLSPRGKRWTASTILGNASRLNGILNNRLYIGEYVWNRQRHVKNPDNSKRTSRANSPTEHVTVKRPELRIIDDVLWSHVKAEQANQLSAMKEKFGPNAFGGARRKKYLLSGLIKCATCGGDYISQGRKRWACGNHRDRGSCDNKQGFKIELLERLLFETIKSDLLTPQVVKEVADEVQKQLKERRKDNLSTKHKLTKELNQKTKSIGHIIAAISAGTHSDALTDELQRLEASKSELEFKLSSLSEEEDIIPLPANYAQLYQSRLDNLTALFEAPEAGRARDTIRSMIEKIVVHPTKRGRPPEFEVHGSIAGIFAFAYGTEKDANSILPSDTAYRISLSQNSSP